MNAEQLAYAAERVTWSLVLGAREQVNGLDPDLVAEHARSRAAWLDERLGGATPADLDDALATAKTRDRNAAWAAAMLAMRSTLSMVQSEEELSSGK